MLGGSDFVWVVSGIRDWFVPEPLRRWLVWVAVVAAGDQLGADLCR